MNDVVTLINNRNIDARSALASNMGKAVIDLRIMSVYQFQRISYLRQGRGRRVTIGLSDVVHAIGGYRNDSGSVITGDSGPELERSGR